MKEESLEKAKEEVMQEVEEHDVKFIRLWFTDLLGQLKSFAITREQLEKALEEGMGFDGSSIAGYQEIHESDMIAMPDPKTFRILPWRPQEKAVARMICDVLNPDRTPYEADPRYILKKTLAKAKSMGYDFYTGPELEYFYFRSNGCPPSCSPEPIDVGGYFDLTPLDLATDLRRDTIFALEAMGINVEFSHHEVAPSQHEIDMHYADALEMADNAVTFKLVVKEIARKYGVYASFMPKPLFGENGSGMHTHQSLFKGKANAFFDPNDKYNLSKEGKHYVAGLLKHAKECSLIYAQTVNSYKRLVPGYEAPVYISWGRRNRSALVRVPMYNPGKEKATRAELRCPDPASNPYLVFAVMLASGLEGIKNEYPLPEPIERNIFKMSEKERKELGIDSLPATLGDAIEEAENSGLLKETIGETVFERLIELKKEEWDNYRIQVTEYELKKYFPIL